MTTNVKALPASRYPDIVHARNEIAALLSIVPGLGHIYKGHFAAGFLWMVLGMPIAVFIGILLGLATGGIGLLFPVLCWAALAVDAYCEPNRRRHNWFPPALREDEAGRVVD